MSLVPPSDDTSSEVSHVNNDGDDGSEITTITLMTPAATYHSTASRARLMPRATLVVVTGTMHLLIHR